jgi:hypothetical protein
MSEEREIKGILVKLHLGGVKVSKHLLWHLIFKGSDVLTWFLLFEFFFLNKGLANQGFSACLAGVLSESCRTRKSLQHFNSQLKPIHKKLEAYTPCRGKEFLGNSLLDYTLRKLNVPKKGLSISRLLTQEIVVTRIPRPRKPSSMGVGYKDKGSLGSGSIVVDPVEFFPDESLEFEDSALLSLWKGFVDNCFLTSL